jgi:hypothetical protein
LADERCPFIFYWRMILFTEIFSPSVNLTA